MKVLYIVTAYPRRSGDVITPWLVETIQRLRQRGVEVEVLAPSYRGLPDQEIDGVRVHRFRYAPRPWETLTHDQTAPDRIRERPRFLALVPSYVIAGSLAAMRLARSGEFDLIHVFWPLPHGVLGGAGKWAGDLPLVSTFFGVELSWLDSQLGLLKPVVQRIIRASDAVTVISSHTASGVRQLVPEAALHTVPFSATVEVSPDQPPPSRSGTAPFQLLFVGRLVERKGVPVLLRAIARVRETHEVRLSVVGDGPMQSQWQQQAEDLGVADLVEFPGLVSQEELSRCFSQCDAFVLPAVRDAKGDVEGLGVVLIEALAYGRPVIASASGGIVDIVKDGQTGLLVPEGDAEALTEAIIRYIDEPGLAHSLAEQGRSFVASEFSWDRIINDLVSLYQGQVQRRQKKRIER